MLGSVTDEHEWLPEITGEQPVHDDTREGGSVRTDEQPVANVAATLILDEEANALADRDRSEERRLDETSETTSGRRKSPRRKRRALPAHADAFETGASRSELEIPTAEHPMHRRARKANTALLVALALGVLALAIALWVGLTILEK